MAYWWVSQNKTFKEEFLGGYLWAPKKDSGGRTPHHWRSIESVAKGDIILSFRNKRISAVGVAESVAYPSPKPVEFFNDHDWSEDGRRVDVQFQKVEPELHIPDVAKELLKLLPKKHSPLTKAGGGTQGYLFSVPPDAAHFLLDKIDGVDIVVERAIEARHQEKTVRTALIQCRVGQGPFREDLIKYWSGCCAVTGVRLVEILRASHIKPWRDSNDLERLDCFNGLLLSPTYDALFDKGLISFDENGQSFHSPLLTDVQAMLLGIKHPVRLTRFEDRHMNYLRYHRDIVFKTGTRTTPLALPQPSK